MGTEGLGGWWDFTDMSQCFLNPFTQQFMRPFSKPQYAILCQRVPQKAPCPMICKEHQLHPRVWFPTLSINVFICSP